MDNVYAKLKEFYVFCKKNPQMNSFLARTQVASKNKFVAYYGKNFVDHINRNASDSINWIWELYIFLERDFTKEEGLFVLSHFNGGINEIPIKTNASVAYYNMVIDKYFTHTNVINRKYIGYIVKSIYKSTRLNEKQKKILIHKIDHWDEIKYKKNSEYVLPVRSYYDQMYKSHSQTKFCHIISVPMGGMNKRY